MKTVLHIINSLTIGGAETLLINSLTPGGLPEKCNNIVVYLQGESEIIKRIDKRVTVICLHYRGLNNFFSTMKKLRQLIAAYKVDIVHSHLNPAGFYTRIALPSKIKQLHTVHIMYSHDAETGLMKKKLEQFFLFKHKSTRLIFLSHLLEADFLNTIAFKNKHFVLNNCIGDEFFNTPKKITAAGAFKMVAIGSLRKQKNYPYLMEICRHLKGKHITLDIYGGGDTRALQQFINENELPVRLMGAVTNVPEVLTGYDLFIMSSTFEGYPLSVIEAMATGLPCFLSNIASLKDTAKEYADYFELDDAMAAANAIVEMSGRREMLLQKGLAAKTYAQQVGKKELYVNRLVDIYENVLSEL